MAAQVWIPTLFGVLAVIIAGLAVLDPHASSPARKARLRVALIFAVVSGFLFWYL